MAGVLIPIQAGDALEGRAQGSWLKYMSMPACVQGELGSPEWLHQRCSVHEVPAHLQVRLQVAGELRTLHIALPARSAVAKRGKPRDCCIAEESHIVMWEFLSCHKQLCGGS